MNPNSFSTILTFIGVFINEGNVRSKPFSFEISYSRGNLHNPLGVVIGTMADYRELEAFFLSSRQPTFELESIPRRPDTRTIKCKSIIIRRLSGRHHVEPEFSTLPQAIAIFDPDEVTIEIELKADKERSYGTFYLAGRTQLLPGSTIRLLKYDGSAEIRTAFRGVLPCNPHLKMESKSHYLHSNAVGGISSLSIQALLEPTWPENEVGTDLRLKAIDISDRIVDRTLTEFRSSALEAMDDVLTLLSFLSKAEIKCFGYSISDGARLVETYRRVEVIPDSRANWDDLFVDNDFGVIAFLRRSYKSYVGPNGNRALRQPLRMYVSAFRVPFVEEKFLALFQILETIAGDSAYLPRTRPPLTPAQLKSLRASLHTEMKRLRIKGAQRELMIRRFGNINQTDLRSRLLTGLRKVMVDLEDIGGEDSIHLVFKERNRLVHGGQIDNLRDFMRVTALLETIIERLLMRLLRNNKFGNSPTYGNRQWILSRT